METPISATELSFVLKSQKNNKATGHDGLLAEFYKVFSEDLLGPMLETCNNVMTDGDIPRTWGEARIVVFVKPGKDPSLIGSYQPISLFNHDAKIFALVMANHLKKIITSYVHQDQTGFTPTRQLADNCA